MKTPISIFISAFKNLNEAREDISSINELQLGPKFENAVRNVTHTIDTAIGEISHFSKLQFEVNLENTTPSQISSADISDHYTYSPEYSYDW